MVTCPEDHCEVGPDLPVDPTLTSESIFPGLLPHPCSLEGSLAAGKELPATGKVRAPCGVFAGLDPSILGGHRGLSLRGLPRAGTTLDSRPQPWARCSHSGSQDLNSWAVCCILYQICVEGS